MPDLLSPPSLFLDSSTIIAGIVSPNPESPARRLFTMGEMRLIDLHVSNAVVREVERVMTLLDKDFQPVNLAENLIMANAARVADPDPATVDQCLGLTNSKADAIVLAAAIDTACEVLVVCDKPRLLRNPEIGPPNTRTVVMALEEATEWARDQVVTRARLRQQQEQDKSANRKSRR